MSADKLSVRDFNGNDDGVDDDHDAFSHGSFITIQRNIDKVWNKDKYSDLLHKHRMHVLEAHRMKRDAVHLIRLFCLHQLKQDKRLPPLTSTFIRKCLMFVSCNSKKEAKKKTMKTTDNEDMDEEIIDYIKPKKKKKNSNNNTDLTNLKQINSSKQDQNKMMQDEYYDDIYLNDLYPFYVEHFKPIFYTDKRRKAYRDGLNQVINGFSREMETSYKRHLIHHYFEYVKRYSALWLTEHSYSTISPDLFVNNILAHHNKNFKAAKAISSEDRRDNGNNNKPKDQSKQSLLKMQQLNNAVEQFLSQHKHISFSKYQGKNVEPYYQYLSNRLKSLLWMNLQIEMHEVDRRVVQQQQQQFKTNKNKNKKNKKFKAYQVTNMLSPLIHIPNIPGSILFDKKSIQEMFGSSMKMEDLFTFCTPYTKTSHKWNDVPKMLKSDGYNLSMTFERKKNNDDNDKKRRNSFDSQTKSQYQQQKEKIKTNNKNQSMYVDSKQALIFFEKNHQLIESGKRQIVGIDKGKQNILFASNGPKQVVMKKHNNYIGLTSCVKHNEEELNMMKQTSRTSRVIN